MLNVSEALGAKLALIKTAFSNSFKSRQPTADYYKITTCFCILRPLLLNKILQGHLSPTHSYTCFLSLMYLDFHNFIKKLIYLRAKSVLISFLFLGLHESMNYDSSHMFVS